MSLPRKSVGLAACLLAVSLLAACGSNSSNTSPAATNSGGSTSAVSTSSASGSSGAASATSVTTPVGAHAAPTVISSPSAYGTPASGAATTAAGSATAGAASSASGSTLSEVTTDNKFSQTSFTIKAGQSYTLNLKNDGQAIHNWHVLNVKGADGKDITTPLLDGGKSESVTFTITKPGTYNFQCDVHPTEMKGTITVQ